MAARKLAPMAVGVRPSRGISKEPGAQRTPIEAGTPPFVGFLLGTHFGDPRLFDTNHHKCKGEVVNVSLPDLIGQKRSRFVAHQ